MAPFHGLIAVGLLVAAVLVEAPTPLRLLLAVVGAAILGFLGLTFETSIDDDALRLTVAPLWRKQIPLDDVAQVEITVVDNQVELFGGWSARENAAAAFLASVEGDQSVGNRAVVLHLHSGKRHQVGTFRPDDLKAAIEASTGLSQA